MKNSKRKYYELRSNSKGNEYCVERTLGFLSRKGMQLYQIFLVITIVTVGVIYISMVFSNKLKQDALSFGEIELLETKNTFYLLNRSLQTTWLVSTAQVLFKAGESGLDPSVKFFRTCAEECKEPDHPDLNNDGKPDSYKNSACVPQGYDESRGCFQDPAKGISGPIPLPDSDGNRWCKLQDAAKTQCCCGGRITEEVDENVAYWYKMTFDPNSDVYSNVYTGISLPKAGKRCNENSNPKICLPQSINFKNYFMYPGVGKFYEYLKIPGTNLEDPTAKNKVPDKLDIKGREIKIQPIDYKGPNQQNEMYGFFWPSYDRVISEVAPIIDVTGPGGDTTIKTQGVQHNDIYTDFEKMIKAGWMTVGIAAKFRTEADPPENKHKKLSDESERKYLEKIEGIFESRFGEVKGWLGITGAGILSKIVEMARSQVGTPYHLGWEVESEGFDCSHLVHFAYTQAGEPATSAMGDYATANNMYEKFRNTNPTPLDKPTWHLADLCFFDSIPNKPGIDHVGLYSGYRDGKYWLIHASSSKDEVVEVPGFFAWSGFRGCFHVLSSSAVGGSAGELDVYVPPDYSGIFIDAGKKHDISPALIAAIFKCGEHSIYPSRDVGTTNPANDLAVTWPALNRQWATSDKGAKGPFQFVDGTWRGYGDDCNNDGVKDVQNLNDAACGAARYLKYGMTTSWDASKPQEWNAAYEYNRARWYADRVYACYQLLQGAALQEGIFADWQWKALELTDDGYLHYKATVTFSEGKSEPGTKIGSELVWPTTSKAVTSCYADRSGDAWEMWEAGRKGHGGIDIGAPAGSPVYAVADGEVVKVVNDCSDGPSVCNDGIGNQVTLKHRDKNGMIFYTQYAHLKKGSILVRQGGMLSSGDIVKAGQKIAETDNSGASRGQHLHFEINTGQEKSDKTSINPCLYLDCASSTDKKCPKTPPYGSAVNENDKPVIGESGGYELLPPDAQWCEKSDAGKLKCNKRDNYGHYELQVCKFYPGSLADRGFFETVKDCKDEQCRDCLNILEPDPSVIRLWPTGRDTILATVPTSPKNIYEFKPRKSELVSCWGETNQKKNYELRVRVNPIDEVFPIEDGKVVKICLNGKDEGGADDPTCKREYGNYVVVKHEPETRVPQYLTYYTQYNYLDRVLVSTTTPSGSARWVFAIRTSGIRDDNSVLGYASRDGLLGIMVYFESSSPNFKYTDARDPLCLFAPEYFTDKITIVEQPAGPLEPGTEVTASVDLERPEGDELQACLDSLARKNCDYAAIEEREVAGNYYYHDEENNVFEKKPFTLKFNVEDWVPVG